MPTYNVEFHGKDIQFGDERMTGPSGVLNGSGFKTFEEAFRETVRQISEQSTVTIHRFTVGNHENDGICFEGDGDELRKLKAVLP